MLDDVTSIYFQTELRFLPVEELRFTKAFARDLFFRLGETYENLTGQDWPATMSTKRVTHQAIGVSSCRVSDDRIAIEEAEPEVDEGGFVEIVQTVLKAVEETKEDCPPIFGQRNVIRCVAKPLKSEHSITLLAGKVANVLNAIEPFERPPLFFGIRFRFPPYIIKEQDESEGAEPAVLEEKSDFASVRFETWTKDVRQVWMELSATKILGDPIAVSETSKIGDNIKEDYAFLVGQCVRFLNQFDDQPNPPGQDTQEPDGESK